MVQCISYLRIHIHKIQIIPILNGGRTRMDKSYWTKFYAKHKVGDKPSLFAQFVWDSYLHQMQVDKKSSTNAKAHNAQMHANAHISANTNFDTHNTHNTQTSSHTPYTGTLSLLELGCGNGRDALFFAKNKIQTTAIDQVADEISYLASHCATTTKGIANPHFIAGDFTNLSAIFERGGADSTKDDVLTTQRKNVLDEKSGLRHHERGDRTQRFIDKASGKLPDLSLSQRFDCIYSRFTLHSITHTQQENLLSQIPHFLAPSGIVAIEARGKKNSLYRQGEPVEGEANAFIHDSHYRRFVDFESLCEVLESQLNLTIHFAKEDRGFAPFNGEDDYFFRVVGIARNERERERVKERDQALYAFVILIKLDSSELGVSYAA